MKWTLEDTIGAIICTAVLIAAAIDNPWLILGAVFLTILS